MRRSSLVILGVVLGTALGACVHAAPPASQRSVDPDPIGGILAAFERSPIVGFGERHRSSTCHAFLRELIRDPRFAATVRDIVVEFATPFHQDILDRFVVDGADDVDERELRTVWQDTTQLLVWDAPIYRELLVTVRDVNRTLPRDRRVRVLGGDPPIDWSKVHTPSDYGPFGARDPDYVKVIEREVLAKHRKALLVIGAMHLPRQNPLITTSGRKLQNVTQLLAERDPDRIFVVWTVIGSSLGLRPRELRSTKTELGARSFAELMPHNLTLLVKGPDGKPVPKPIPPSDLPPIRELVDALLYLGPDAGEVEAPAEVYRDASYVAQLRERAAMLREMLGFDLHDIEAEIARAKK
jgi:hypothetical protein